MLDLGGGGSYDQRMRAVLVLSLLVLLGAAALLTGGASAARHARPRVIALDASRICSSASSCVQGCALPVASTTARPGSPASPCAKQSDTGCSEYVTAIPTLRSKLARPSAGARTGCEGSSLDFAERTMRPGLQPLGRRDEELLRRLRPKGRILRR